MREISKMVVWKEIAWWVPESDHQCHVLLCLVCGCAATRASDGRPAGMRVGGRVDKHRRGGMAKVK